MISLKTPVAGLLVTILCALHAGCGVRLTHQNGKHYRATNLARDGYERNKDHPALAAQPSLQKEDFFPSAGNITFRPINADFLLSNLPANDFYLVIWAPSCPTVTGKAVYTLKTIDSLKSPVLFVSYNYRIDEMKENMKYLKVNRNVFIIDRSHGHQDFFKHNNFLKGLSPGLYDKYKDDIGEVYCLHYSSSSKTFQPLGMFDQKFREIKKNILAARN